MGPDPLYGALPGQLPAQVCVTDHREAAEEAGGGGMELSSAGSSDEGSGFCRDKGINQNAIRS